MIAKVGEIPIEVDEEGADPVFVLAHGAGGSMNQKTVLWLADRIRAAGGRVVRFDFLYRARGRSMPDRMPTLIETYRTVVDWVREVVKPERLILGGHSMGGRVASMLEAEASHADGLVLFGYPLHPAGQPEKRRDAHLAQIKTPVLQLNGTHDALCTRELMEKAVRPPSWVLHWLDDADHSYALTRSGGRTRAQLAAEIEDALRAWLGNLEEGRPLGG